MKWKRLGGKRLRVFAFVLVKTNASFPMQRFFDFIVTLMKTHWKLLAFSEVSAMPMWSNGLRHSEVLCFTQSEVKFAKIHLRSKLHYAVTSLPKATSLARKGKLSWKRDSTFVKSLFHGAVTRIRTGDLILTKDALYLLSYNSISDSFDIIAREVRFVNYFSWNF